MLNHISILIVDDDINKISSIIKTIKEVYVGTLSISQASCVQEAIENLKKKECHLLITDLKMPLKYDDAPLDNGGNVLVKSIYRNRKNINVPLFITALSQFDDLTLEGNTIWKVLYYDASISDWKIYLRDMIFHISLIQYKILSTKIETLFVEGPTDKLILEAALNHFFVDTVSKIYIDTISYGGGATWVERQLFIWAKSLAKKEDGEYMKAVGMLDNDDAGRKAEERIRSQIELNSAESLTFSIVKCAYKYSPLLKSIKDKGVTFCTTIEDLISPDCWTIADANGWLEARDTKKIVYDKSQFSNGVFDIKEISKGDLKFNYEERLIITKRVKDNFKKDFCQLICKSDKSVLNSIKFLLEDVFLKLKVNPG